MIILKSQAEKMEAARQLCKKSLKFLCRDILEMKDWDVCHDDIERFDKSSTKNRQLLLIPREHLKTSVFTIGRSIQEILNNPNISILIVNEIIGNSIKMAAELKAYLTRTALADLFGSFVPLDDRPWRQDEFTIAQRTSADKTPTITCAGVGTALTSQHYDKIVADDILSRDSVNTSEQIQKTRNFYSDLLDLQKKPNGKLCVIGTRWHDSDLYGQILDDPIERALFDVHVRAATDDATLTGKVIFPKKFNSQILADLRASKGSYDFSCQYFNQPVPSDTQHFKPPVRYWDSIPTRAIRMITVDPAPPDPDVSGDPDYNVITACRFTKANQLIVEEYRRGRFSPSQVINHVFDMWGKSPTLYVGVESVIYQKVLIHLLDLECKKRGVFLRIVPIIPHKSKFQRIMGLQPLWESGNILLKRGMIELEDEFSRFPRGKHDDILDTLAMQLHLIQANMPEIRTALDEFEENMVAKLENLRDSDPSSYTEWKNWRERKLKKKTNSMAGVGV